jgi:hypothetical protein
VCGGKGLKRYPALDAITSTRKKLPNSSIPQVNASAAVSDLGLKKPTQCYDQTDKWQEDNGEVSADLKGAKATLIKTEEL